MSPTRSTPTRDRGRPSRSVPPTRGSTPTRDRGNDQVFQVGDLVTIVEGEYETYRGLTGRVLSPEPRRKRIEIEVFLEGDSDGRKAVVMIKMDDLELVVDDEQLRIVSAQQATMTCKIFGGAIGAPRPASIVPHECFSRPSRTPTRRFGLLPGRVAHIQLQRVKVRQPPGPRAVWAKRRYSYSLRAVVLQHQ